MELIKSKGHIVVCLILRLELLYNESASSLPLESVGAVTHLDHLLSAQYGAAIGLSRLFTTRVDNVGNQAIQGISIHLEVVSTDCELDKKNTYHLAHHRANQHLTVVLGFSHIACVLVVEVVSKHS
jgi:hypothetical protein